MGENCGSPIPRFIGEYDTEDENQFDRRRRHLIYAKKSKRIECRPVGPGAVLPIEDNYTYWARNCFEILRGALIFGFVVVAVVFLGVAFVNAFCDGFHYFNIFGIAAVLYCMLYLVLRSAQYLLGWQEGEPPPEPTCLDRCLEATTNVITRPMKSPVMAANAFFETRDRLEHIAAEANAYEAKYTKCEEPVPTVQKQPVESGDESAPPIFSSEPAPSKATKSEYRPSQLRQYQFEESRKTDSLCWEEPEANSTARNENGCDNLEQTVRRRCNCACSNRSEKTETRNFGHQICCSEDPALTHGCPPRPRRPTAECFYRTEDY